MKISVVIVCFNAERTIGYALESYEAQDHADRELLVIDGGSRDGTVKIVESFAGPDVRLISEPDSGLYDAMNKGLRSFAGEAVGFLNADDRYADAGALGAIASGLDYATAETVASLPQRTGVCGVNGLPPSIVSAADASPASPGCVSTSFSPIVASSIRSTSNP